MEETTILIHPQSGKPYEFEAEHAKRILGMGHGWKKQKGTSKKQTASAAKKRDTTTTGSKAQQDDDCGCNKS
jgi:hypothetical protein